MVLDIDDSPNEGEIAAAQAQQAASVELWKKQSFLSGFVLLITIGVTALFLAGMPLHSLWENIGKYFLFVTFGGMIWALHSITMLWGAVSLQREFKKTYTTEEN